MRLDSVTCNLDPKTEVIIQFKEKKVDCTHVTGITWVVF